MTNIEIARIFENTAVLLELEDANPFRVRAYRRAALSLEGLTEDVARIAERGELREIAGIGVDLSQKIEEYLKTGKIRFYEELRKKTPPFLLEMLQIPGVGPKTAKLIQERFRPANLARLKKLAGTGKLATLAGIREKSVRQILEGIELLEKRRSRSLLGQALPMARSLVENLGHEKAVADIACAGSLRRLCETIGDIDILASSDSPKAVMDAFLKMKNVWKVLAHGDTKSSVVMKEGMQVDIRVVEKDAFGAALLYFTGSKAHNIQLRSLAKKKGWKINEYGLFHEKTGRRLAARTEKDIYEALRLSYIPPELREDQGEIDAARAGRLPRLVEKKDIRGDLHLHSNWTDGADEIEEMVQSAQSRGLDYLVLTDHSQSLRVAGGLSVKDLLKQIDLVRKLGRQIRGIKLLAGSEVDILGDGSMDYPDEILKKLDFVVGSVHSRFKQSKDELTRRIIRAMQNPHVRLIGHPTGRLIHERNPYEIDFDAVFKEAARTNTALEINSFPQRLDLKDVHARRAVELGATVAVTTDSHTKNQFDNLEYGVATARRAWCEKKHILNCLPFEEFQRRIAKKSTL